MVRPLCVLLVLALIPAMSACSSSKTPMREEDAGPGDAGPIGPDPVPADALCSEFADEFCRANETCCGRPAEVYDTFTICAREQRQLCQDMVVGFEFLEAVDAEDILYNQGRIGSALERVSAAGMACDPIVFEDEILNGIMGTVDEGGTCVRISCRDGLACIGGTCQVQPEAGAACETDEDCGALNCASDMTCQPFGAAGAGCDVDDDCESRSCMAGSCEAFNADNAYCVRQPETQPFRR